MAEKTISEFLSYDYKEFAMYVVEGRAIPSLVDGFKPTQRKIMHGSDMIWRTGNEKKLKVFQLSGYVAHNCYYHHGDASLSNAIINIAQKFKNNAPLLESIGQFGSLRSPQSSAPRYIETKLSDNFRLIYKDFDLLDYKEEEGESIEPKYFLPIIPTVLINGGSGIAVGFASNILNRNVFDIIDECINIINGKKCKTIPPHLNDFTGSYIMDPENNKRWLIRGKFEKLNTTTVKILELPPSLTYEKYEEILDRLVDNKDIVSYDNNCKGDINYVIKFTRADLDKYDDDKLFKLLKLEESQTEIYSTLDEFGKLKIFENTSDIIEYFVQFRLKYYDKRKEFLLNKLNHDLKILRNRGKFIREILEEKLKVNNVAKQQIISQIEEIGLEMVDNNYDYLLRMPIYSLTKELYDKLKEDFKAKKDEIETLKVIEPKSMYLDDLKDLKKKLVKIR